MIDLKSAVASDDKLVCDLFMDQVGLACVTVMDELDLFDEFYTGPRRVSDIAEKTDKDERALERVCRVLTSMGFLEKHEDLFFATEVTKSYLIKRSPTYKGFQFYSSRETWAHKRVLDTLNLGWSPIAQGGNSFTEMWEKGSLSQEAANRFTAMMHTNISGPAISIARSGIFDNYNRIVDVGGASGVFLAALAQHYPEKEVALMELPQVCEAAKNILNKYVPLDNVEFYERNFFDRNWNIEADAIYLSNIIHDWPYEKGVQILKNAYYSLNKGSTIFINEALLDEGYVSPKHNVIFDLMMYMNHKSQQYTETELKKSLEEVGFTNIKMVFSHGYYSVLKAEK